MGDKSKIAAISGFTTPCETMFLLKKLLSNLGSTMCDGNQLGYGFDLSARGNYLFNSTIAGIEKADICLIIGANPKQVAPVLNARIGKMVRNGLLTVSRIGEADNQTYKINELGNDIEILEYLNSYDLNTHKTDNNSVDDFANLLSKAVNPMIIVGDGVLSRSDSHGILSILYEIAQKYNVVRSDWNGFNILHNHASMVGALDLGFIYGASGSGVVDILNKTQNGDIKILYLLGADDIDMNKIGEDVFVIYQGHHGDAGANRADLILPEAAYTEQEGMYVNMEGRVQLARAAVELPNLAKTGISIISMVAKALNIDIGKNELHLIRQEMTKENKIFDHVDEIITNDFISFKSMVKLTKKPLEKISMNYYMTDPITRASITMAKCTKALQELALSEIKNRTE